MAEELYRKTEEALKLIAEGKESGVDLLYTCAGRNMLFMAKSILGDTALAEDAVQESFLKIVKYIRSYKKGTNAYSWVCKITKNTAIGLLDKKNKSLDIQDFLYLPYPDNLEDKTSDALYAEKLLSSLTPPFVKKIVYMKYYLDMTVREIAAVTGKSKSYVSKEISAAEEKLKKLVDKKRI